MKTLVMFLIIFAICPASEGLDQCSEDQRVKLDKSVVECADQIAEDDDVDLCEAFESFANCVNIYRECMDQEEIE